MAGYTSQLTLSATVIKQNDTYPSLILTFQDNSTGSMAPVDLTGAGTIKIALLGKGPGGLVTGTCTVLEATHGTATWAQTETNVSIADTYSVEGNIAWSGGTQTFPNAAQQNPTLEIDSQLDPGADL